MSNTQKPLISSLMRKKASSTPYNWKTRLITLTSQSELSYYKPHDGRKVVRPIKTLYVKDASFCFCNENKDPKYPCFKIIFGIVAPEEGSDHYANDTAQVRLTAKQAAFFFYCRDQREMRRWKEALIMAGAHFLPIDPSKKSDIWYNHARNWALESVIQYLGRVRVPNEGQGGIGGHNGTKRSAVSGASSHGMRIVHVHDLEGSRRDSANAQDDDLRPSPQSAPQVLTSHTTYGEYYGKIFREYNITGEILIDHLTDTDLFTMGMVNPTHRSFLLRHIRLLRRDGIFKEPRNMPFVMKLERHLQCFVEAEMYQLLLNSLTSPHLILNTYLSQREDALAQLISQVYIDSSSSPNQKPFHPVQNNTVSIVFLENTESCKFQDFVHPALLKENSRPARVILVDSQQQHGGDGALSSTSTTQSAHHEPARDGVGPVHAALLVGNILLDWNSSSVVVPRHVCQGMIGRIITSSAYSIASLEQRPMHAFLEHIAKIVCHYNAYHTYDCEIRSSVHFVLELLRGMDLNSTLTDPRNAALTRTLKLMHQCGEICPQYISPLERDEFLDNHRDTLQIDHRYHFTSFRELDQFVNRLLRENSKLSSLFGDECRFLRMLSGSFWLRHFEAKDIFFDCNAIVGRDLLSAYGKS